MKCSKCGGEAENGNYCNKCGEKLKDELIQKLENDELEDEEYILERKDKNEIIDVSSIYNDSIEDEKETVSYNRFGGMKIWFEDNIKKLILGILIIALVIGGVSLYKKLSKDTPKGVIQKYYDCFVDGDIDGAMELTDMDSMFNSLITEETKDEYYKTFENLANLSKELDIEVEVTDMEEISRDKELIKYKVTTVTEVKGIEAPPMTQNMVLIQEEDEYKISILGMIQDQMKMDLQSMF